MKINNNISSIAFKCRGLFWGIFATGILIFPGSYNIYRFITGILLLIIGQLLRLWAAGYIPKYRTETIGAPELITSGPYAIIRNPLYAGNAIMGVGWTVIVSWYWVIAFALAFLLLYYSIIIPAEEKFLEEKFGREYLQYKQDVPALFPNFSAKKNSCSNKQFNLNNAINEEIYSIYMNIFITIAIIIRLFCKTQFGY